ncbi:hypothetical protein ACTXJ1_09910 [Brachybacterium alimentarium]|uniref:hypothetical protein n=1 Tax=Brachybacterium alimentarium TaxID=47845 RepID=UPI003FD0EEB2
MISPFRGNPLFRSMDSLPHGWQVLATVLLGGSITAISYGLTQAGLLELASSFLTFYVIFVGGRLIGKMRRIGTGKHFRESSQMIGTLMREMDAWVTDRKILALALLGLPVTVVCLAVKASFAALLGLLSSWYFALAVGLLLAAVVCSPLLFSGMGRLVMRDGGGDDHVED